MRAQCQHCGHIQTLRRSSKRRKDERARQLFQCSSCHRYSPISETKVEVKTLTREKSIDRRNANELTGIQWFWSQVFQWGFRKLGLDKPEPETQEPEPEPEKEEPRPEVTTYPRWATPRR